MRAFGMGPATVAPTLVNRALERESWARESLAAHAGRTFAIAVGPATTAFRIDAVGALDAAARNGSAPDLVLEISPLSVPSLLANPKRWDELVVARGDATLAATLKGLAETLPWFVERAFAEALGPIAGQFVADAGRRMLAFPGYAGERVGNSVSSYMRDEVWFAATSTQARSFGDEIAETAARVDALAARIEALALRVTAER